MKDLVLIPIFAPLVAQIAPVQTEWERLGITGLSIMATVFIWRYFNAKQDAKDLQSSAERDRLLKEANAKNQEIIDLLKQQIIDSRKTTSGAARVHTVLENSPSSPVHTITP